MEAIFFHSVCGKWIPKKKKRNHRKDCKVREAYNRPTNSG